MIKKHKVMIVGAIGAGKSSLAACINGNEGEVRKTQSMVYDAYTIDTPGEYMENPRMYRYIIAAAQDAEYVIFVQDIMQRRCVYPPGFARSFNCKAIGVITKADDFIMDIDSKDIDRCVKQLKALGIEEPIFVTSAKTGNGMKGLSTYLFGQNTDSR